MSTIERAYAWLSPKRRATLYGIIAAVGTILTLINAAPVAQVAAWIGVVTAAVELAAGLLAWAHAHRLDVKFLYACLAALAAALRIAGVITDGQEAQTLAIAGQILAIIPLVIALLRTDPHTPTGEPAGEYAARHSTPSTTTGE